MKHFALFFVVAAYGFLGFAWFATSRPALDRTQLSQITVQALVQNPGGKGAGPADTGSSAQLLGG